MPETPLRNPGPSISANVSGPVLQNRLTLTFSMRKNEGEDGDNLLANTTTGLRSDAISKPQSSYNYTTRATAQLAQNHVLNTSVSFGSFRSENQGVGGEGLPEQGSIADRGSFNFQVKETAILSRTFNNEVRFRVGQNTSENIPLTEAPHIDVTGAFQTGGSTQDSQNTRTNWEFGNLLMYTGDAWALRFGFESRYLTENYFYKNNFLGTFTFDSLEDYIGGMPSQYEVTLGDPVIEVSQFESAAFLQSDWRARNNLTLSFGLRYEDQTNLSDHNNFDPRIGFAYSVAPNVVLRGGTGIFHDRFGLGMLAGAIRVNGVLQTNVEIKNPSYPNPFLSGDVEDSVPSVRRLSEDLTTPYTWNSEGSLETSFNNGLVLTGSYRFIRGAHLYRTRNVNAPFDADATTMVSCAADTVNCVAPDPNFGKIAQLESSGTSTNHNVRVGVRQRFSFVNLNGSYNFNSEYDDVAGNNFVLPSDNYNLDSEWARSGSRHRVDSSINWRLPLNVNANTRVNWSSGSPYTLRTGIDDNQDGENNDRPLGVPRNSLDGPGFFEMDLNLSKSIQLRSDTVDVGEPGGSSGPAAGGGYYGQRTGVRMTITADIENLLNKVNYSRVNGVQTSSFFGQPTRARDGRRINLSVRFNF
jgi:hypothetical protein